MNKISKIKESLLAEYKEKDLNNIAGKISFSYSYLGPGRWVKAMKEIQKQKQ